MIKNNIYNLFYIIGDCSIFLMKVLKAFRKIKLHYKLIVYYMYEISGSSVFVLLFASFFVGMVSSYQIAYQLKDFMPMVYISTLLTQAVLLEIGPLLTGISFIGKVSSSIAAEISSMKITDQIDALEVMSINPIEYLVMPRVLASALIIPFLLLMAEFMMIMGGFAICVFGLNVSVDSFVEGTKKSFQMFHIISGMIKVFFFGFITVLIACYFGMKSGYGAKSVGNSTALTVITASVVLIIFDYILTRMLFIW